MGLFEKKTVILETPDKALWKDAKAKINAAGIRGTEAYSYDAKPSMGG